MPGGRALFHAQARFAEAQAAQVAGENLQGGSPLRVRLRAISVHRCYASASSPMIVWYARWSREGKEVVPHWAKRAKMTCRASLAQGIEHRSPKAGVVRSNRIRGTIDFLQAIGFPGGLFLFLGGGVLLGGRSEQRSGWDL